MSEKRDNKGRGIEGIDEWNKVQEEKEGEGCDLEDDGELIL